MTHAGYLPPHYWSEKNRESEYDPHAGDGWYFYDECEMPVGPYVTEAECDSAKSTYRP